jgi:hypothetical protein
MGDSQHRSLDKFRRFGRRLPEIANALSEGGQILKKSPWRREFRAQPPNEPSRMLQEPAVFIGTDQTLPRKQLYKALNFAYAQPH